MSCTAEYRFTSASQNELIKPVREGDCFSTELVSQSFTVNHAELKRSRLDKCTSSSCLSNMAFTGDGWVAEDNNCCRRIIGGCGPSGDMSPRSGDAAAPSSEFENKICISYFTTANPPLLKVVRWPACTVHSQASVLRHTGLIADNCICSAASPHTRHALSFYELLIHALCTCF